jgi:hypothetical protein
MHFFDLALPRKKSTTRIRAGALTVSAMELSVS